MNAPESPYPRLSRRRMLLGTTALVGIQLVGLGGAAGAVPGVRTIAGGDRPTFVPAEGSTDPVAHAIAETLFWTEQLKEHGTFFAMLMPGDALAGPRAQAEKFQTEFAAIEKQARGWTRDGLAAAVRSTIDATRRFIDYKRDLQQKQTSGKLQSLVWPTFFDHTAREAEYFVGRLDAIGRGELAIDADAAARFWLLIMGEHAGFVGHLLDPREYALVAKALKTQSDLLKMHHQPNVVAHRAADAVDEVLDFKVAAQQGIRTGEIRSIIAPALADHVRREAIKASDELRRAA